MSPAEIFSAANSLAMLGWLLYVLAPRWKWTPRIVIGVIVMILSACYVYFIASAIQPDDFASFGSLEGVMQLFTKDVAVLGGWLHYLAFDLMVGWFILSHSQKHGVPHLLIVPCLLLTFMLGPTGLLLYWIIKTIRTKQYFLASDSSSS